MAHEMTLKEARPLILASLKASRAREEVQRRAREFTAKVRAAGGDFAKAAAAAGLQVRDFQGLHRGEEFPGLGVQPALDRQLFDLKGGEAGDLVMVSSGAAVLQFRSSTPGGPLPFQKVKDRVGRDLTRQTRVEGARKMIAAAGATADLAAAAKKLKVEVKSAGPVPRS